VNAKSKKIKVQRQKEEQGTILQLNIAEQSFSLIFDNPITKIELSAAI
jgi:hypothetical protein